MIDIVQEIEGSVFCEYMRVYLDMKRTLFHKRQYGNCRILVGNEGVTLEMKGKLTAMKAMEDSSKG